MKSRGSLIAAFSVRRGIEAFDSRRQRPRDFFLLTKLLYSAAEIRLKHCGKYAMKFSAGDKAERRGSAFRTKSDRRCRRNASPSRAKRLCGRKYFACNSFDGIHHGVTGINGLGGQSPVPDARRLTAGAASAQTRKSSNAEMIHLLRYICRKLS